ncbi:MAG: hypothetical protein WBE26_12775 [Phycisphaerae bacterium]
MLPIFSGTTRERIVRTSLMMILINGFAIAFLWDGYVGYARRNAQQLIHSLGLRIDPLPAIHPKLTAGEAQRLMQSIKKEAESDAVTVLLGEPSFEHDHDAYYLGPAGHLRVRTESGRVASVDWTGGVHTETDQALQRWVGLGLGILGAVFIVQLVRVLTMRVLLTDAGLKVSGKPLVPFESIRALRAARSGRSGRVELDYSIDGRPGRVRLDDYVVKEFRAIVTAICERAGFPNPYGSNRESTNAAPADAPQNPER